MPELLDFLQSNLPQFRGARLASLYSDFRYQKSSNPDGYLANSNAWELGLSKALEARAVPGSTEMLSLGVGPSLLQSLETKQYGRPQALDTVLEDAISQGSMVPLQDFLRSSHVPKEQSWIGTFSQLLQWGVHRLPLMPFSLSQRFPRDGQLVVIRNLEHATRKVIDHMAWRQSRADRVMPATIFRKEVSGILKCSDTISESDLKILLVALARGRFLIHDAQTVKIRGTEATCRLDDQDRAMAWLQSLMADLTIQLEGIASKMNELKAKARMAIAQQNRSSAEATLRLRHLHEETYKRRADTLIQLESTYRKIIEATDQVETIRVMRASASALKGLNAEIGDVETVEDLINDIRNEIQKVDEVSSAMLEGELQGSSTDQEEIDGELEVLVEADRKEKETRKVTVDPTEGTAIHLLSNLPKVPEFLPSAEQIPQVAAFEPA